MHSTSRLVAGGVPASRSSSTSSASGGRGRSLSAPVQRRSASAIVARALAAEPSVLVLDEPLASLDASAQAQLANLLVDLSRRLSLSLLLISHDLAIVRHVADVVSVMYLGVIVETGPTQPLWSLPLHPYTEALIGAVPSPDGSGVLPKRCRARCPIRRGLPSRAGFIRAARTPSTAVRRRSR